MISNGYGISFWGDENLLKLVSHTFREYAKTTELYPEMDKFYGL